MLVVQIEKPESRPLAGWFEELRTWLDGNGCSEVSFIRAAAEPDRLRYRITFEDDAKAKRFAATFARYMPAPAHRPEALAPATGQEALA